MVEEIKHIEPELHGQPLDHPKILPQARVRGPIRRIPQTVALLLTECAGGGLSKHRRLEPDHARRSEIPDRHGTVAVLIPELIAAAGPYAGIILAGAHRKRRSRLVLENPGNLPAAQKIP